MYPGQARGSLGHTAYTAAFLDAMNGKDLEGHLVAWQ